MALNKAPKEDVFHPGTLLPKSLAVLVDSSDVATTRFRPLNKVTPSKFLAGLHTPLDARQREYLPVAPYPPVGYIPHAAGIGLGRLLGASPLVLFYLGRLFGLGAWIVLVFLAIKTTPILKWSYFLLALMPMTLCLAVANSVDSVVIGVAFLLSAQLLSWAYDTGKERIGRADMVWLVLLALVLALSKPLYLLLLSLFVLVPRNKFPHRTRYHLAFVAVIVSCLAASFLWSLLTKWATTPGPTIDLARHAVDVSLVPGISAQRQLAFIVSHPFAFLGVLVTTFSTLHVFYLSSFVGVFGWLDTPLPAWLPYVYVAVVIAVSLLSSGERVGWKAKCLSFGLFGLTWLASLVFIYTVGSAVGMSLVYGFQGRYLIPVAPMFFLIFHHPKIQWRRTNILAAALIVFVAGTTAVAGYRLVNRFYVVEIPSYSIDAVLMSPVDHAVVIRGWAIDRASDDVAAGVDVELDGQYYRARYGLDRADVADRLKKPAYRYSGFEAKILIPQSGRASYPLALRILAKDNTWYIVPEQRLPLLLK